MKQELYGNLGYNLRKNAGTNNFSEQFIRIISYDKNIVYNSNILRHTACLVVNQITLTTLLSSLIAQWWVGPQTL